MCANRSYLFSRPPTWDPDASLALLSMGPRDPSAGRLGSDGWQALRWIKGGLCRVLVGWADAQIAVVVDGPGSSEVGPGHAQALLGLHDVSDWKVHPRDPLYPYWRARPGLRLVRVFWLYEAALQAVLSQRVSGREAALNWARLCWRFGERRENMASAPSPERLSKLTPAQLASCGIEAKRATPLYQVALRINGLIPDADASPESVERLLAGCRGIGPWTLALLRAQFWGDADAVPPGDYGLPALVGRALAGERAGTEERMLELLEPYRPHRFRVIRYLWASPSPGARRAPRLPIGRGIGG
jgi:hypothetical protein